VKEEDLPVLQDNEFYVYQLIGMIVSDVDGAKLGVVKEVLHTGACDIVVVENDKELLIPMIEEYILEIDTMKGQIKVTRDAIADAR
jgi:16S rRNA processing protein RimM